MEGVKKPAQDGWLWTSDQEGYHHVATLEDAIADAIAEAAADWDGCGGFEVFAAYRVDLAAAAQDAAETAIQTMGNGVLETAYVECPDELEEIHRSANPLALGAVATCFALALELECLARAFAADIERVCGPWYETLGRVALAMQIDEGTITHVSGRCADQARAAGWTEGSRLEGFDPSPDESAAEGARDV